MNDERTQYVPIGCGDCMECRKRKAREWQVRLQEDLKKHKNAKFITLTFSDESILKLTEESHQSHKNSTAKNRPIDLTQLSGYQYDNALATLAVRYFMERYRKKYKTTLRHWLVTELGHHGTQNIHLHGIIWTDLPLEEIERIWAYGYMWKGKPSHRGRLENYVNERTVNYIIKYLTKKDTINSTYKSIILTSPGIGGNYVNNLDFKNNKYNGNDTNTTYRTNSGHKVALPIYWRNKAYTEEQREQLWLQTLDKQQRFICGEKIDISKDDKDYWKTLKYYQKKNKQLGYGNGEKTWEQEIYEQQKRDLLNAQRRENAKQKMHKLNE